MNIRIAAVAPLLFLSGMCALVFQITWMREFRMVFGASTAATAAVLAIFMGGLGLGNAILGKLADRMRNPLRLYAQLELVIALVVFVTPWLVLLIRSIYVALGGQSALGVTGATTIRLALSTLVLGLPTVLMGGTLPAAAAAVTTPEDGNRRGVALLYGLNTLGAVLGATVSTFVLLERFGTHATLWLACTVNLITALAAWGLSRGTSRAPGTANSGDPSPEVVADLLPRRFVYLAAGVVGFAFFLMELVWFRMLTPLLGGTTYSFGLILVVALAGIGIGGALYSPLFSSVRPTARTFALLCALEAACIALPFALGDRIALLALFLRSAAANFVGEVLGWSVVAAIVVLPVALVSGLQFPLLIALLGKADRRVGTHVGFVFFWNTAGAILGSLAGGFGLLPYLGALGSWSAATWLLVVLGLAAVGLAYRAEPFAARFLVSGALIAASLVLILAPGPTAAWRHSGIGAGRTGLSGDDANSVRDWLHAQRRRMTWEADGVESSIGVAQDNGYVFIVNGKADGHAFFDAGSFVMPGILGSLLHPNPTKGLVVGLGTGVSAGWLADVPTIERVDVVDFEPAVDEVARLCSAANRNVLEHPKVRTIYNDAREMLLTSTERYDVVYSQPSNPYRAGIANLFTREFYATVRESLSDDGIFLQWLQAYEIDRETVGLVLATLRSEFEHVEVWQTDRGNLLLVCAKQPLRYGITELRRRVGLEPFRAALSNVWHTADVEGLLTRFIGGPALVERVAAEAAGINTDDRNRLEYVSARLVGRKTGLSVVGMLRDAMALGGDRPETRDGEVDWARVEDERVSLYAVQELQIPALPRLTPDQRARARALSHVLRGDMREAIAAWESQPREPRVSWELPLVAYAYADQGDSRAVDLIERLRELHPVEARAIEAIHRLRNRRWDEATTAIEAVCEGLRADPWPRLVNHIFPVAEDLVREDPSQAARLYAALKTPFAIRRLDERRRRTACRIAAELDGATRATCVEGFEPHVPWTREFLTARDAAYAAANHPLRETAARDLRRFHSRER